MTAIDHHRRRIACVALTTLLFLVTAASKTVAETVLLRAGEHPGFSRIVLDQTAAAGWNLGRGENGYVLRLGRGNVDFDLGRVYKMIPRSRIADLVQTADSTLQITLGCDCHATGFVTSGGSVVVDIADGPPRRSSLFETPIAAASSVKAAPRPSPHPEIAAPDTSTAWRAPSTGFGRATPDPGLALFRRGGAPMPSAESDISVPAADPVTDDASPHVAAPQPDMTPRSLPDSTAAEGRASDGIPPELPILSAPVLPDPRFAVAQHDLLEQLSRAATQGLLEVDRDRLRLRSRAPSGQGVVVSSTSEGAARGRPGMHSETSIDRDSKFTVTRAPVTATGGTCIANEAMSIGAWGDDRPASQQIAERRAPLVGEFDDPSNDAVLSLARLYLFLGFGAEARAVLTSFGVPDGSSPILQDIGLILDGYDLEGRGTLPDMTGCDTFAAMWAVLAWRDLPPDAEINEGAVLRAFSALPPHLRRNLGPGLSARLLSADATSSARAIRDAVARIPGDGGAALDMMDGRLSLARGDIDGAMTALVPLAAGNDPLAVEALILSIESKLDRQETVDPATVNAAAALAYEHQDGADGPILTRLHILARGASGDFAAAFYALHRWPGTPPEATRHDTVTRLFGMLAETADDGVFLTEYFNERELVAAIAEDDLQIALAQRLADAGFGDEVRTLLSGRSGRSETGRLLLAEAALIDFNPAQALAEVAGLPGQAALDIQARALAMDGDHLAAATTLTALGQAEPAALAAWRGGDWEGAATATPEAIQRAIRDFGLLPEDNSPDVAPAGARNGEREPEGELARGRALLAGSQSIRATLNELLSATEEAGL